MVKLAEFVNQHYTNDFPSKKPLFTEFSSSIIALDLSQISRSCHIYILCIDYIYYLYYDRLNGWSNRSVVTVFQVMLHSNFILCFILCFTGAAGYWFNPSHEFHRELMNDGRSWMEQIIRTMIHFREEHHINDINLPENDAVTF